MSHHTEPEWPFPVVDFGAHLLTDVPPIFEAVDGVIGAAHTDPDEVVRQYDEAGIEYAVLSQPPLMGNDDADYTAEQNDALLGIVERNESFFGLAGVPTRAGGEAAAAELERCLENGYHGGALETMSGDVRLTDEGAAPILEVADDHGAPLLVHPKIPDSLQTDAQAAREPLLDDTYRVDATLARETELSRSVIEVIHTGLLDRYPDLNLVYHHLGGNIAAMLGRVHLHLDIGRWPGQEHVKAYPAFKAQLEERIYLDTAGFFGYHLPVRAALEELPSTQVVFGTDFPYEPRSGAELDRFARAVADVASVTDAERVLGRNTLDLLVNR